MNLCMFTGRIGQDLELTEVSGGKTVLEFSIAVNEGADKTTWVRCQAWGDIAEKIAKYFTKGRPISVVSRVKNEQFTNKDGEEVRTSKYVLSNFFFVPGGDVKKDENDNNTESNVKPKTNVKPKPKPKPKAENEVEVEELDDNDEIPF